MHGDEFGIDRGYESVMKILLYAFLVIKYGPISTQEATFLCFQHTSSAEYLHAAILEICSIRSFIWAPFRAMEPIRPPKLSQTLGRSLERHMKNLKKVL